jgi:hypothetical protein
MINISKLIPKNKTKNEAYKLGFDCAINKPNTINCHFSIFSTPENTKSWEEGKQDGEKYKLKILEEE